MSSRKQNSSQSRTSSNRCAQQPDNQPWAHCQPNNLPNNLPWNNQTNKHTINQSNKQITKQTTKQVTTFPLHTTPCCVISTNPSTTACCDNSLRQKIGGESARFPKNFGVNVGRDTDTRDRANVLRQFLWPKSPDTMECVGLSADTTVRS